MEKIFITIVVLYALFVGLYFLRIKADKKRKKNIIGEGGSVQEKGRLKTDIVGKSRFDLRDAKPLTAKSEPLTASSPKSENQQENQNIFAPPNEEKPSPKVPNEELDETFSDTPPDEENELLDVDCPLEYETSEDEIEDEDSEEEEFEEVEGMAGAALASGVEFEDLGNAVRTVNRSDEATPEQRKKAGHTLLEMRKTDMFEQVVSGKPDAKRIVTDLMTESLADFYSRKDREAGTAGNGKRAPESFNIRDFA